MSRTAPAPAGVGAPSRLSRSGWYLLAPLLLFLSITYILPLLGIAGLSVTDPEPGFENYSNALSDPLVRSIFWRTLRICLIVTVVAVGAAYMLTYVWVNGDRTARTLAELAILIPFWISVLTRAFGWLALLSNRGIINTWAMDLGLLNTPLTMVRNEFGVVLGMVHFLIPFAVFPLASAMRGVDKRVLMAARGMGATRFRTFWQIYLPMTLPGLAGATLLTFVFALGFFVTPALLGGGRSVMIAELIYLRIFQIPDWGLASALSVLMMSAVSLMLWVLLRRLGAQVR